MLTLYGSGQSRSFRNLWALEEAQVPYDYVQVKIGIDQTGGTRTPDYLKMNSQGKVPTLVDGDLVLTESGAILNYIGALAQNPALLPTELKQRALYDQICFFVISDLEQPLWTKGKHKFAIPAEYRVADVIPITHWEFAKSLKALAAMLSDKPYALGEQFSLADIMVAQTLSWAQRFEYEVPEQFTEYAERMYQREACQRALAKLES